MKTLINAYKRQTWRWIIGAIGAMLYPFLFSIITIGRVNIWLLIAGVLFYNATLYMVEKKIL